MSLLTDESMPAETVLPAAAKLFLIAQQTAALRALLADLFAEAEWLPDGGLLIPGDPAAQRAVDLFALEPPTLARH